MSENGWDEIGQYLNTVAHQIAQARPSELLEFVKSYPEEKAQKISTLMVLAWRIVGNEFKEEMAEIAAEQISFLCDIDEHEKATEALRKR